MTVYAGGREYSGITGRAFGSVNGVAKLEYSGELLHPVSTGRSSNISCD